MKKLFEILSDRKNKDTVMVTVISTEGSVPGKTGAYMLVGDEGRIYGTVGGGRLEYMAILKAKELLDKKEALVCSFDTSEIGTACGGSARLLFCPVNGNMGKKGTDACKDGRPYRLALPLGKGSADISYNTDGGKHRFIDDGYYYEDFNYDGMVYIFGGGHLSRETVPLLKKTGFRVTVIDDREEYADSKFFPDADNVLCMNYDNINIDISENDYIAIMTRDHLGDYECEKFALGTSACYIGAVGSRAKTEYINKRLASEGIAEERIKRVFAPIGIDIGSRTPAEIAVSICAQLIKIRWEKLKNN